MTVLSAALVRYGNRHIVVLVDDPPDGNSRLQSLQAVEGIRQRVTEVMDKLRAEADDISGLAASGSADPSVTAARLSPLYICAAEWLEELARDLCREASVEFAHVDRFFADDVVLGLATTYRDHISRSQRDARRLNADFASDRKRMREARGSVLR